MTSFSGGGSGGAITVSPNRNNILAMDGHSQIAQMYDLNSASLNQRQARGFGTHFCRLAMGKYRTNSTLNLGVGGATTVSLLTRLSANISTFVASGAKNLLFKMGTNDATQVALGNYSFATFEANYLRILQAYQNSGLRTLVSVDSPRTSAAFVTAGCTAGQATNALLIEEDIRQMQRSLAGHYAETLIIGDSFLYWLDRTSTVDDPKSTWAPDGTHANDGRASFWEAYVLWQADQAFGQQNWHLGESNKGYDMTYNPFGNRLLNGRLQGTAGTLASSATGVVPDSWTLTKSDTHTPTVGSQATAPNGQNGTVFQIVATADGAGSSYKSGTLSQSISNITPGETLEGRAYVSVGSTVNFGGVKVSVTYKDVGAATLYQAIDGAITAHPDIAHTMVCEVDAHVVPVGAVTAVFAVDVGVLASDVTSTATVQLRGATLHAPAT